MISPTPVRNKNTSSTRWLLGSVLAHACLMLVVLVLLRPADPLQISEAKSADQKVTSAHRLEVLSEQVRELQTRQINEKVKSLGETLELMEQLESDKTMQLREAYPEQTESATEDVKTGQDQALEAQGRALDKIESALEAFSDTADPKALEEARDAVLEDLAAAEDALAQMASAQVLADAPTDDIEQLIELQVTASQLLAQAKLGSLEAVAAKNEIQRQERHLNQGRKAIEQVAAQRKSVEAELAKQQAELENAQLAIAEAKQKFQQEKESVAAADAAKQQAGEDYNRAREAASTAQQSLQQAQRTQDKPQVMDAQRALMQARQSEKASQNAKRQAENHVNQQRHKSNVAEHAIKVAEHRVATMTHQMAHKMQRLEHAQATETARQAKAAPSEANLKELSDRVASSEEDSITKFAKAKEAQQRAIEANQTLDLSTPSHVGETSATAETTLAAFQLARALERQVAQRFKNIQAAELALVQQMKPEEARQLVSVALPERASLDETALDQNARTRDAMQHNLETLNQANRQAQKMDDFAKSLLSRAQELQPVGLEITLAERQQDAAEERKQSADDQGGAVRDMTALMAKRSGKSSDSASSEFSESGSSSPSQSLQKYTVVDDPLQTAPPVTGNIVMTTPARRFGSGPGKAAAGWVFVDSWYILGPFDNARRANIHKQFPPESLVDLDAKYRSSASPAAIEWEFYQATTAKIEPRHLQGEYVIYYAWTELNFESATDVWIAVGSDDRSDLWINDVRVWSSSDILKAWRIDEGLRRVRFEAGMNKVLYRVENGNGPWAFSLGLNLDSQVLANSN